MNPEPVSPKLPPGIKPGTREARQFHDDLIGSLQSKLLDHQVQNPGLFRGEDGNWMRPVPEAQARLNYAAALAGQPHDTLAHLGFSGPEPIDPELAHAVAHSGPVPSQHAYAPDPVFQQLHADYALAKLAPVAAQTAFQTAGGPAALSYMQTSKKPNVTAFEKFKSRASDVTPILDAAKGLRESERGFGIDSASQPAYKSALDDYLGPPPSAAPRMAAVPPKAPVTPPPATYGG